MTDRDLLLDIIELLPEPSLMLTREGGIVAANRACEEIFGVEHRRLTGLSLVQLVSDPHEKVAGYLRLWRRSRSFVPGALTLTGKGEQGQAYRCEGAALKRTSAQSTHLVLVRFTKREESAHRFVALSQRVEDLAREVFRRKQAEESSHRQREWLHVTLQSIGDAVITTDADGRVTFMNPVSEALTEWPIDQAFGKPFDDVFVILNELTRQQVESPVGKVLRLGEIVGLSNHTILIARGGVERPIDDSAAPIRNTAGEVIGVVLVFHDVTEKRRLEHALNAQAARLLDEDRRKNEFLAMLGHELRNPLAPLRTGAQVLRARYGGVPETKELTAMMERQIHYLTRLVDDLLDVARITQGRIELHRAAASIRSVLERAVEMTRPMIEERAHSLSLSLPSPSLYVEADITRLTQVFVNLLSNAAKFTDPEGRITVAGAVDGEHIKIRVSDSGIGIRPDIIHRIFDLFLQGNASTDRAWSGLGLGLTVAKVLVEMHRGSIEVRSEGLGRGSEFIVTLPILETREEPTQVLEPIEPASPMKTLRILVVDDNVDAAETLGWFLSLADHEVQTSNSAAEALETSSSFRPEVVLLDIGLPGMDGYELANRLRREQSSDALIIALTGYGQAEDRERAIAAGCDHHLTKPADLDDLLRLITERAAHLGA